MAHSDHRTPRLPPRRVIRTIWSIHRALAGRLRGGRWSLSTPAPGHAGLLRLWTTGRRSGLPRDVLLRYVASGDDLVTLAMNGWDTADPAWWLNLQTQPRARVDLADIV